MTKFVKLIGIIGMSFVEAPAIFKRNGVYYALFGNCCCCKCTKHPPFAKGSCIATSSQ